MCRRQSEAYGFEPQVSYTDPETVMEVAFVAVTGKMRKKKNEKQYTRSNNAVTLYGKRTSHAIVLTAIVVTTIGNTIISHFEFSSFCFKLYPFSVCVTFKIS